MAISLQQATNSHPVGHDEMLALQITEETEKQICLSAFFFFFFMTIPGTSLFVCPILSLVVDCDPQKATNL